MQNISKDDFAHIDVHVSARMRILSSSDELPIFNGYVGESKQVAELLGKSKLPEELLLFLDSINTRLEHIISILEQKDLKDNFPISISTFSLGGSKILFRTDEKNLKSGDNVEVVLPLSQVPLRISGAIGVLGKNTHTTHGDLWSISFTRIREQDLENIVQFVFDQERKRIREIRWE